MIDIDKVIHAFKASWIKRIFDNTNRGLWKNTYFRKINRYGGKLLLQCDLSQSDIKHIFGKENFLYDVINSWHQIHDNTSETIRSQIIWNNSEIKVGEKNTILRKMV